MNSFKLMGALAALIVSCGVVGCGSSGKNTDTDVTFGKLTAGSSQITVPKSALGDVDNVTVTVFKNGVDVSEGIPALQKLDASSGAVKFSVDSLAQNDGLAVLIQNNDIAVYAATVGNEITTVESLNCATTDNVGEKVACALCKKWTSCGTELTQESCLGILLSEGCTENNCAQVQLDNDFGVPVEENSVSWQMVIEGEDAGIYMPVANLVEGCLEELQAPLCADVEMNYNPMDPKDLGNMENLVEEDGACAGLYGTPGGL